MSSTRLLEYLVSKTGEYAAIPPKQLTNFDGCLLATGSRRVTYLHYTRHMHVRHTSHGTQRTQTSDDNIPQTYPCVEIPGMYEQTTPVFKTADNPKYDLYRKPGKGILPTPNEQKLSARHARHAARIAPKPRG